MNDFRYLIEYYLQESDPTFASNRTIERHKMKDRIIIIKAKKEDGDKISGDEDSLVRDDPSFMYKSSSKIIHDNASVENEADLFSNILEKASKIPSLRVMISDARINVNGGRPSFVGAYTRANRKWENGDEGKRMKELKVLYRTLKKSLSEK
jgi:hypothetical protein